MEVEPCVCVGVLMGAWLVNIPKNLTLTVAST